MSCDTSNIRVEPVNVTWGSIDLGFLEGDVEPSFEEKGVEVTAHQEGTNILDMIRTGKLQSLELTLKETAKSQVEALMAVGGDTATATAEVTSVTCVADAGGNLGGKYFLINSAGDAIQYYLWLDVDDGSTDPAPAGKTGIEVDIATGDSADTVAAAVQAAVDLLAGFVATVAGPVVTITNASTGGTTDAVDFNTLFTIAVTTQGVNAVKGWGKTKDFLSMAADSAKLVLHPVNESGMDRDLAFWKAYPMLNSIHFSGESPETMKLSFKIFPDCDRADEVRWFVYGNHL